MRNDYITREQFIEQNQNTLTLMDDRFMKLCLDGNIPCVQAMIDHIIDKKLTVIETHAQKEYKGLHRSIAIDVYAEDSEGRIYDIEIQNDSDKVSAKRARFYGAMMDVYHLDEKEDFDKLPECYVIFITRKDVLKHDKSMYTINRYIEGLNEPFNDDLHIVYVNCSAQYDGSKVWKLIHDMICPDPEKMFIRELADRVGFFKSTKKGREQMSDWFSAYENIVEKRAEERGKKLGQQLGEKRGLKRGQQLEKENIAVSLIKEGLTALDRIAKLTGLKLSEVTKLAQNINAQRL